MKFAALLVLCSVILAVTSECPLCSKYRSLYQAPSPIFNNPNTSNAEIKEYFVDYISKITNISPNVLRRQSLNRLATVAIDELNKRLREQPDQAELIKSHMQYFENYRDSPVPLAPFVDLNKDLSRVSQAEIKNYLVGYLHALTNIDEVELSYRDNDALIEYTIKILAQSFENSKSSEDAEIIRSHYNYFLRLQAFMQRQH